MIISSIDGVKISGDFSDIHPKELLEYVQLIRQKHGDVVSLYIRRNGEFVDIEWFSRTRPYERIQRSAATQVTQK